MITDMDILNSLRKLDEYVKIHDFSGFDPYDALNSQMLNSLGNKLLRLLATQALVYSPINVRNFFQIQSSKSPKAIGLFLKAYINLYKNKYIDIIEFERNTNDFIQFLIDHKINQYSGMCWGFNFDWQDITRYTKKDIPTIVITSYIAQAFLDMYELTEKQSYLDIAASSCTFILKDLSITNTECGICFSYTPIDKTCVHNANVLGAAVLSRLYSITKNELYREYAEKAFNFLISYQKKDGSWSYSVNVHKNRERNQIDFHQGFILDSIYDFILYIKPKENKYINALKKGADYYTQQQFNCRGVSKWRMPWRWPIDIHHQAQGIITSIKLYSIFHDKAYLNNANIIAEWTIDNMQDEKGFFYYQKWPILTNKIPYMRWGQAWMMYALSTILGIYANIDTHI